MKKKKFMQCLWLEKRRLSIRQVPVPTPKKNEALIHVSVAGICGTDIELIRGYYPFRGILGHEFVGEVVAAPSDPSWIGKRVVGEINLACGKCPMCRSGLGRHCFNRSVLGIMNRNGAFAQYLSLPLDNLHSLPADLSNESAVFCEPLAASAEIVQQVSIGRSDRVLLLGAGRMGQLIAQVIQQTGCHLQVAVRNPLQRRLLVTHGIKTIKISEIPKNSMDVVIEATGNPEGFLLARRAVRPRGTLVLKSTYRGLLPVDLSALVVDEITLVGSRCGPFELALRLLRKKLVDPRPLVSACYPLSSAKQAFRRAQESGVIKVLLRPDDPDPQPEKSCTY